MKREGRGLFWKSVRAPQDTVPFVKKYKEVNYKVKATITTNEFKKNGE
jgi:hypothetical protein